MARAVPCQRLWPAAPLPAPPGPGRGCPSCLSRSSAPCSDFFSHLPACSREFARGSWRARREHEPDGQLGHRDRVGAGRIHHHNAPPRCRIGVDVVHAHAGASDHPQLRSRLQQCVIHLHRGTNHQRIRVGQFRGQPVLDLIVGHDLPTTLALQHSQGGGRDFLCQYDLHCSPKGFLAVRAQGFRLPLSARGGQHLPWRSAQPDGRKYIPVEPPRRPLAKRRHSARPPKPVQRQSPGA